MHKRLACARGGYTWSGEQTLEPPFPDAGSVGVGVLAQWSRIPHNGRHMITRSAYGRGGEVFARVTLGEALPERLDEMTREIREHVLPALKMQDGFTGILVLADRKSGKVRAVTLWESEQAMNTTEEAAYWLRVFSAGAAGGEVAGVERYEVVSSEEEEVQP